MAAIVKVCESSSSSSYNSALDCPVCLEIPRKEIYLCSNGHSICDCCIKKISLCPVCRAGFLSHRGKARNFLAEALLDGMKFPCPWKDLGCQELVSRGQLSNHEHTCIFGPLDIGRVCIPAKQCRHPISARLLNGPKAINSFLSDMIFAHGFAVKTRLPFGSFDTLNFGREYFKFRGNEEVNECTPTFVEIVNPDAADSRSEVIMLVYRFRSFGDSPILFSWAFVWLTEGTADPNYTLMATCAIECNSRCETVAVFGHRCTARDVWTIAPMKMSEFKKDLTHQSHFPCSLPVDDIQDNYVNRNGVFTLLFCFNKVECQKRQ